MERETGIEPATNSLEGCDSTTELLPLGPQRLKPLSSTTFAGTTKVVPFPSLNRNCLTTRDSRLTTRWSR